MGFLRIDLGGMAGGGGSGGSGCEGICVRTFDGLRLRCSTSSATLRGGGSHTAARHSWDRILSPETVTEPGCHWLVFLEGVCSVSLGIARISTHPPSATHTHASQPHMCPATRHPTARHSWTFSSPPHPEGIIRSKYHQPRPILPSPLASPSRGLAAVRLHSLIPNGVPGTPAGSVPGQRLRGVSRSRTS